MRVRLMFNEPGMTTVCNDGEKIDMGSVLEWLVLEICGFYVNVIVSVTVLLFNYSPLSNLASVK